MKLPMRPSDDLNWKIEEGTTLFEFDLGLNDPYFPLEDELHFQSLGAALAHFGTIMPENAEAILYRGSADFSQFFQWSEAQEANFALWKGDQAGHDEAHLKRLFCAEAFVAYFQMLAHKLPDELPLKLILDPSGTGTRAQTLHLLSPERFEHFIVETGEPNRASVGVCFPPDSLCSPEVLERIDQKFLTCRPVYETLLTEQWDGLDEIIVFPEALSALGKRKLMGFRAAGGKIREEEFRGRGI